MRALCSTIGAIALASTFEFEVSQATQIGLDLNLQSGEYSVTLDGAAWHTSSSYAVRSDNKAYDSASGGLLLVNSSGPSHGSGEFGSYVSWSLGWAIGDDEPASFVNTFYLYAAANAIVFEQFFPLGLNGTSLGQTPSASNDLATAFPAFGPPLNYMLGPANLTLLTWSDVMCKEVVFPYNASGVNMYYFGITGGPVAWYNASLATLVMSPLDNMMVSNIAFASLTGGAIGSGITARVDSIPPGWSKSTLMVAGQGINATMMAWGDLVLQKGDKSRIAPDADFGTSYMTYWSDNGAYYYYNYAQLSNGTYEQTMKDVIANYAQKYIPLRGLQYDSWWYYKTPASTGQSLLLWEPMGESVFPDGFNFVTLPLTLHNRYFAAVNNYTVMPQFNSSFIIEPLAYTQDGLALPIDPLLLEYLMSKALPWGMTMYEQDWLTDVFRNMNATQSNLTAANDWLTAIGTAATALNITVQFCMASPRHIMQSSTIRAVTNARASGDYHYRPWSATQWAIGSTSIFYHALGVQPTKDTFWTTEVQPNNPFGANVTEPNTFLHTLMATLSTGPVGASDKIGLANATLLYASLRSGDGKILKPDLPAMTMDVAFRMAFERPMLNPYGHDQETMKYVGYEHEAVNANANDGDAVPVAATIADGEIVSDAPSTSGSGFNLLIPDLYQTYSAHGSGSQAHAGDADADIRWHYIVAVRLPYAMNISYTDIVSTGSSSVIQSFVAVDWFSANWSSVYGIVDATTIVTIPAGTALPSAPSDAWTLRYILLAPVLPSGWVLLGEYGKFVTMSGQRVSSFNVTADGFIAGIQVPAGENSVLHYMVIPPPAASAPAPPSSAQEARNRLLRCSDGQSSHFRSQPDCGSAGDAASSGIGARFQFRDGSMLVVDCPASAGRDIVLSCGGGTSEAVCTCA